MRKILICGLPRSGTTAAFYAVEQAFPPERRIAFLEPKDDIKRNLPQLSDDVASVEITKILVEDRFRDGPLFERSDHAFLLVRDPRDVVVSWLPYRLVSRAAYTLNDRLRNDLLDAFRRKASDPESVSIRDILALYRRHKVPVLMPKDYGALLRSFGLILARFPEKVRKVRFDDLSSGNARALSEEIGRDVTIRRLEGEISVNQRNGSTGEWRQWFTPADVNAFRAHFSAFLEAHQFDTSWDHIMEEPIDFAALETYIENARQKRQALQDQTKEVERISNGTMRALFGNLKRADYYTADNVARLIERCQHGNLDALREFAMLLEHGIGVERDPVEAARYYKICSQLGDAHSRDHIQTLSPQ